MVFLELGEGYYKIKNRYSNNALNSWGGEVGRGTATMQMDLEDEYRLHRQWYFVPIGDGSYKIKNRYSRNCLDCGLAGMQLDYEDQYIGNRHWYIMPLD
jgi:hypothetical protein